MKPQLTQPPLLLQALEDRLQGIIEPHLSAALAERKGGSSAV